MLRVAWRRLVMMAAVKKAKKVVVEAGALARVLLLGQSTVGLAELTMSER